MTPNPSIPDLEKLPDDALLTRQQMVALSGFALQTFKKWARQGRGPVLTYVEGRPRATVRAYREWVSGTRKASA